MRLRVRLIEGFEGEVKGGLEWDKMYFYQHYSIELRCEEKRGIRNINGPFYL